MIEVDALWAAALVAIRRTAWPDAERALTDALARPMPYPYGEARLLEAAALPHRAKGEPGMARERVHEALAIARRLGAKGDEARLSAAIGAE